MRHYPAPACGNCGVNMTLVGVVLLKFNMFYCAERVCMFRAARGHFDSHQGRTLRPSPAHLRRTGYIVSPPEYHAPENNFGDETVGALFNYYNISIWQALRPLQTPRRMSSLQSSPQSCFLLEPWQTLTKTIAYLFSCLERKSRSRSISRWRRLTKVIQLAST